MTRRGDEEQELLDSLNREPTPVVHQTHTEPSMNNVIAMADIASSFQRRKASIRVLREDAPETIKFVEETVPDVKKDLEIDYHAVPLDELLNRLGTDQDLGMSASNVSATLKKVGPNKIVVGNRFKWILKWIGYLFGGFGLIVWPSAILCILAYRPIGDPPDKANLGVGIVLAVSMLLTAFFSGWQDFTSSKVMNMIGNMLPAETLVVRDGVAGMIPVTDIVPGDFIRIENGTKIAADIRVIESNSLKVDNSILTGESEPISLTDKCTNPENYMESKNVLFMGTSIVDGSGTGIVVATGNNTMMGKIAKMAAKSTPMTPIQKEIYIFMIIICIAGFITALTTLFAWLFWLRVRYPLFMNPGALVIALIGALTAFLPNGLPISVSLTFTVMAQRMFKKNVLVKFLPTVETLGSIVSFVFTNTH
jgi:sodium/potassium-transporting ATPase subunit alpha